MRGIFPLTLAPFEEYLLADDKPGYRMTFVLELTFDGEMHRQSFDLGLEEALRRHPLLASLVERRRWGRPRWVRPNNVAPAVDWGPFEAPIDYPDDGFIDLEQEVGVRFCVRTGADGTRMSVQFHHSCCDGMGAIQFLADLLSGYVRHFNPTAPNLPELQNVVPEKLRERDELSLHFWDPSRRYRFLWECLCQVLRVTFRPVARIAPPRCNFTGIQEDLGYPGTLTRTLEKRVFQGLKMLARRYDVTVNELLLAELFITLRDWNRIHRPARLPHRIGVLVPTNLRNERHDGMPAANVMSYHFCVHDVRELDDPAAFIKALHEEQLYVKRWRFSALLTDSLRFLRRIPGLLNAVVCNRSCRATAVLSCVGDPSRAIAVQYPLNAEGNPIMGNLTLTDVNAAPPIRASTPVSFTAWQFDDKLRLGVRCDPRTFSRSATDELLELYCNRVNALGASVAAKVSARTAA